MGQETSEARAPAVENVELFSRRGGRLAGAWHSGRDDRAVIVCHGMESTKDGTKSVRLARRFATAGCAALRFDFSYVGESEGEFQDLTISGEVDDLWGAWAFVRSRCRGPIAVVGSSLGGTVALLFAADQPDVKAVATIAAVADPGRLVRSMPEAERERWRRAGFYDWNGMRLRSTFLEDVLQIDVLGSVERIACPLLVTHGTRDAVVPVEDADRIAGRARAASERLYPGADHRFSDADLLDRLLEDIAVWVLRELDSGRTDRDRKGA